MILSSSTWKIPRSAFVALAHIVNIPGGIFSRTPSVEKFVAGTIKASVLARSLASGIGFLELSLWSRWKIYNQLITLDHYNYFAPGKCRISLSTM